MKKNILMTIVLTLIITMTSIICCFAAKLDSSIPKFDPDKLALAADGTATFVAPVYVDKWKRFDVQLLRRMTTESASTGVVYTYKTHGSIQHVDPADNDYSFNITSTGYYQFQIRGVNLEGNYGEWVAIYDNSTWSSSKSRYPGVAVSEDDISPGGSSSSTSGVGAGYDYNYGPGVVNQGYLPYGYQYAIIGPNGQILYNYGNNNNYQQQGSGMQYGPGYVMGNGTNGGMTNLYPNTGVSNYQQVPSPYGDTSGQYGYNNYNNQAAQTNQNAQTNPNYYSGGGMSTNPGTNTSGASPQITQGLEIGWHVDSNGRFYYQGNGVVLKGTWYLIDGSFYRFSNNGYILANQWFQDTTTGYWYYLGGDGRMLLGWQCINGTWYYFKPENGNGYGTMYRNTTLQISDGVWGSGMYAFDANGATVMNAWYGGYYYGKDGKRAN